MGKRQRDRSLPDGDQRDTYRQARPRTRRSPGHGRSIRGSFSAFEIVQSLAPRSVPQTVRFAAKDQPREHGHRQAPRDNDHAQTPLASTEGTPRHGINKRSTATRERPESKPTQAFPPPSLCSPGQWKPCRSFPSIALQPRRNSARNNSQASTNTVRRATSTITRREQESNLRDGPCGPMPAPLGYPARGCRAYLGTT